MKAVLLVIAIVGGGLAGSPQRLECGNIECAHEIKTIESINAINSDTGIPVRYEWAVALVAPVNAN